ncbi:ATPase, F0 complex, subunit J [Rhizophagus diaphanus]|nr:ATPase, F0 complex, subunit J [Rhizophagus diaphanus] [Rhizophagus sp. MUCL 43196]
MSLFSLFGPKYPTQIAKPMSHFFIAASIVWLSLNKVENSMQSNPPYDTDPRNPKALLNKQLKEHH